MYGIATGSYIIPHTHARTHAQKINERTQTEEGALCELETAAITSIA